MADLIGDTTHLTRTRLPFHAVLAVRGASKSSASNLLDFAGIRALVQSKASVKIVSETLQVQLITEPSADKAGTLYVCVIPSDAEALPTSPAEILTVEGSAIVASSIYLGTPYVPLAFASEVAHQIKPTPIIGSPPKVVYSLSVAGGTADTLSHIRISGHVEVQGIGFTQTW